MAIHKKKAMTKFPPAGVDVVEHELSVDMMLIDGKKEKLLETLVFKGRMTLQRGNPYTIEKGKDAGKRVIDFTINTWVASAFSKKLQTEVLYILSEDRKEKPSQIISEKAGHDFPAEFIFNATFDARANNKTIKRRHHGRPHGTGFLVVPPDGNRRNSPTIKGFEDSYVQLKHPDLGLIRFVPRQCNDNSGVTLFSIK